MAPTSWLTKFLTITSLLAACAHAQGTSNVRLDKQESCPGILNEVLYFANPINFNRGLQLMDMNFSLPYPLGQNVLVKIKLEKESPLEKNSWIQLISFEVKKGFCVAFDKYLGEIGYDVERAVGITPKTCPMPKGVYHVNNITTDFTKLRLPLMPTGRTKVIVELHHKQKMKIVACLIFILSNL